MRLEERLSNISSNQVFDISPKSSFIFIGTKDEYDEDIASINKKWIEKHGVKYSRKPIWKREVIEEYYNSQDIIILCIDSEEDGSYWLRSEYQRATGREVTPEKKLRGYDPTPNYEDLAESIILNATKDWKQYAKDLCIAAMNNESKPMASERIDCLLKMKHVERFLKGDWFETLNSTVDGTKLISLLIKNFEVDTEKYKFNSDDLKNAIKLAEVEFGFRHNLKESISNANASYGRSANADTDNCNDFDNQ